MKGSREAISVALFNLLQTGLASALANGTLKTFQRQPVIWSQVPDSQMPFLILFKGGPATEEFIQPQPQHIGLTRYQIHWNLWLYLKADPSHQTLAETTMNNIADAIDAAMQTGAFGERQTLGNLVNNVWIEGGSEWSREFEDDNIVVFWRITAETGI